MPPTSREARAHDEYWKRGLAVARAELIALASDRPAHAAYLAALLDKGFIAKSLDHIPVPRGVSDRVADALADDVDWILTDQPEPGCFRDPFPRNYQRRREADQRAAATRKRNREEAGSLERLLRLRG